MGAESFYVKLSVVQYEEINMSISHFVSKLAELSINCTPMKINEFELESFLIMTIHSNNDKIFGIIFEGCFSWYNDCVLEIYKVSTLIHNQIIQMNVVTNKANEIPFRNQEGFCNAIREAYLEKYNDFMIRYGITNVKCLPREDIYSYIERHKKKSFIKKFFMK